MNASKPRTFATLIHASQVAKRQLDAATELQDERVEACVVAGESLRVAMRQHGHRHALIAPTEDGKGWVVYILHPTGSVMVYPAAFANELEIPAPTIRAARPCNGHCPSNASVAAFLFGGQGPLNAPSANGQ